MWALFAVVGAVIALGVREIVEWRLRVSDKRAKCYHNFLSKNETVWMGARTRHCHKCGFQEPVKKEDEE